MVFKTKNFETLIFEIYSNSIFLVNALQRIQLLYRPSDESSDSARLVQGSNRSRMAGSGSQQQAGNRLGPNNLNSADDAPPKYTPPPSYTTATGARLAKLLRQSIRRSVRR